MSTTRREFLSMLGIGAVAAPVLLKKQMHEPVLPDIGIGDVEYTTVDVPDVGTPEWERLHSGRFEDLDMSVYTEDPFPWRRVTYSQATGVTAHFKSTDGVNWYPDC